jgi:hypothetical protein
MNVRRRKQHPTPDFFGKITKQKTGSKNHELKKTRSIEPTSQSLPEYIKITFPNR